MIYFAATDGNDGNDGSEKRPFKTLQYAMNQLKPGDVLRVKPGIYHEVIDTILTGTESALITVEAYDPNDKPVIDGLVPHDLDEAAARGVDINYGLPLSDGGYTKRNMNTWSKTYGATAMSKALLNFGHSGDRHSGFFKVKDFIIQNSGGRIINFEAEQPDYVGGSIVSTPVENFKSRSVIFEGVEMDWARLQAVSIKNVADVAWLNCKISHAASFWQTAGGRPKYGPQGDLQTHNAAFSAGGVKNMLIDYPEMRECWGEGFITSANSVESTGIVIRNIAAWDLFKTALYLHATSHALVDGGLIYRSAENLEYGHYDGNQVDGRDNPVLKTNGPVVQSSEGNKDWSIATHHVTVKNLVCSFTGSGLSLNGSQNTEPISDIEFLDNVVINPDGPCLTLKGNEPQRVKVAGNIFYQDGEMVMADGVPSRYDKSSVIDGNHWSRMPEDAFFSGPNDVVGGFDLSVPITPLPWGTTAINGGEDKPAEVEVSIFVEDVVWQVKATKNGISAVLSQGVL